MSSAFPRKSDFRLHFAYPTITLTRHGSPEPVLAATLGDPAFPDDFHRFGSEIARARGRVTVVLPEAEVWRGRLVLACRTPLGRRRAARTAVAERLGLPPGTLVAAVGPPDAAGRIPVAAVRRETLDETRSFLTLAGVRPAAMIGAGDFPGFAAPPDLSAGGWRAFPGALLAGRGRRAAAALAAGLGLAAAIALGLPTVDPGPLPQARPVSSTRLATALAIVPAPLPRPERAPRVSPPAAERVPAASLAARNLPLLGLDRLRAPTEELRLVELTTARARLTDALMPMPLRRSVAPVPPPNHAAGLAAPRPLVRPRHAAPAAAERLPVPQAAARPRPRPADPSPLTVKASLAPAALAGIIPEPRPAAPARAAVAAPAPTAAAPRPHAMAPQAVRVAASRPARPQPARAVAVHPARVRPAWFQPQASRAPSLRDMALVGVFGASEDRHALVQLPTGDVRRVRPGDQVAGVQVASVGSNSVLLRSAGREHVLTLPD